MAATSRSQEQSPTSKTKYLVETAEERTSRIRQKNRRQMYLERHPSYFTSPDLELGDPLLYDRCVRRFQSAAEREADGKAKGYSGVLEADLYRSEAKLSALAGIPDESTGMGATIQQKKQQVTYVRGDDGQVLPEDPEEVPRSKEEGMNRWRYEMTMRFLRGDDPDFLYKEVDEDDHWDIIEAREEEDKWFEEEEPGWIDQDGENPQGETGIQDF